MVKSFSIGDVVELNSGGPPMSVCGFKGNHVKCIWFDDHNHIQEQEFDALLLRPAIGLALSSKQIERHSKSEPSSDDDIPF